MVRHLGPLAALVLVAACTKLDPPRVARVELRAPDERIDAQEDVRRSRAEEQRIAALAMDVWAVPLGAEREIHVPATHGGAWLVEAGVDLTQAPQVDRSVVVELSARVDGQSGTAGEQVYLRSATLREWESGAPFAAPARLALPAGAVRIVLAARVIGASPADAALVRGVYGIPVAWRDRKVPAADAPNVLLLSIDTLRADRLGCYGYTRGTSPHLDRLVAEGTLFEWAYSSAPWTLPSYASLFTSLLPADHRAGVVSEREARFGTDDVAPKKTTELLRPDVGTLAEAARSAGWRTAGFYCNPYIGASAGVDRGFDRWVRYQSGAKAGVDLAQAWIADNAKQPWLAFVHLIDPHMPYAPPAPYDERFAGTKVEDLPAWPPSLGALRAQADENLRRLCSDLYDGEIAYADAQLGRLLEALRVSGELDNTVVILHSDHGEEFWEHGGCDHGHALHEELLRVPFAIVWPGRVPAQRIATRVRTLDLYPTLAELLGWQAPHALADGVSLVPLLQGSASAHDRRVTAEAILWGDREHKALFDQGLKYIASGKDGQAYAWNSGALTPLDPAQGAALRQQLLARHARTEAAERPRAELRLDPASKNELARIGYAGD